VFLQQRRQAGPQATPASRSQPSKGGRRPAVWRKPGERRARPIRHPAALFQAEAQGRCPALAGCATPWTRSCRPAAAGGLRSGAAGAAPCPPPGVVATCHNRPTPRRGLRPFCCNAAGWPPDQQPLKTQSALDEAIEGRAVRWFPAAPLAGGASPAQRQARHGWRPATVLAKLARCSASRALQQARVSASIPLSRP